jgi:acyl-CoA thioester hydrolase|tara:strand:- start:382 stop:792 length:411 start_codon:yes stop_codon:yes gene_type:complete
MIKEFFHNVKVYYEDTDSGGVVYYANYLKFLERARSEAIYSLGLSNKKLLEEHRALIIVKSCNINYLKPAKFEDNLKIISIIKVMTKTSFIMKQIVKRDNDTISEAEVHLVIVNEQGRPIKIPEILKNKFKDYLSS